MYVFAKRNGRWIQAASYTVLDPQWKADQAALPAWTIGLAIGATVGTR